CGGSSATTVKPSFGIHLGPHKAVHAAQRTADDEAQMCDLESLGDHPVHAVDHVVIMVMREIALEPLRGFAGTAATERVRHDDEVSPSIQRLLNSSSARLGRSQLTPVPVLPCNSRTPLTISPAALRSAEPRVR